VASDPLPTVPPMIKPCATAGTIPKRFPREPAAALRCRPRPKIEKSLPYRRLFEIDPIKTRLGARPEEYNRRAIPSQLSQRVATVFSRRRGLLVTVAKRRHLTKPAVLLCLRTGCGIRAALVGARMIRDKTVWSTWRPTRLRRPARSSPERPRRSSSRAHLRRAATYRSAVSG
jgi:hypothetical protein